MKIEVGEYVRTEEGIIQKCTDVDNSYVYADDILSYNFQGDIEIPNSYVEKTRIVKHSKNIIDLIEVGDYVNGENVIEVHADLGYVFTDKETELGTKTFCDYQIESIVTHKQFESIEYKI